MKLIVSVLLGFVFCSVARADWKVGLQVGYSPNYLVTLDRTGVNNGTPYSAKYNMEYDGSAEFGINLWNASPHSWGFISGFHYGAERKLNKISVNGISIPVSSSDTSKYQTHFLYAGTLYRWESFYIPLAITYGMTKFTSASSLQSLEVKNGVGALLGLGWFFTLGYKHTKVQLADLFGPWTVNSPHSCPISLI